MMTVIAPKLPLHSGRFGDWMKPVFPPGWDGGGRRKDRAICLNWNTIKGVKPRLFIFNSNPAGALLVHIQQQRSL
jgi:hypothetical protein